MEDDEDREECIEMNIKGKTPFNILASVCCQQISVGDEPIIHRKTKVSLDI